MDFIILSQIPFIFLIEQKIRNRRVPDEEERQRIMSEEFNNDYSQNEYTGQSEEEKMKEQPEGTVSGQTEQDGDAQQTGGMADDQQAAEQTNAQQPDMQQMHDNEDHHTDHKKKKTHKPMTTGKKWATLVAGALVFGLVAGGTMVGVNAVGGHYLGRNDSSEQIGLTHTGGSSTNTSTDSQSAADGTESVADVAENAMPSLVTISTMSVEEMRNFFGGTQQYEVQGAGTGVIVGKNDTELLIATNYHVVEGATSLSVGFIDEASIEGQIKGTDVNNDLAVVSVKLSDIPDDTMDQIKIATVGDSDDMRLGDQVVAIGNALGYGQSVTSGYVSALDRDLTLTYESGTTIQSTGLIQTDAAINAGNSGGALLNMKGELIGINEAKSSSSSSGASVDNIGFAIPIDKAESSLQDMMNLETREKVDESQASYLGIRGTDVSSEAMQIYGMPAGAAVSEVVENGPADKAGIKQGDIITELDGRSVSSMSQLQDVLQYYAAGEKVDVVVQRANNGEYQAQTLTVTLGSAKDAPQQ